MLVEGKLLVERHFRDSGALGEAREAILTWRDLASEHVVVVLGDPGAGKSTEFEEASRNPGSALLSVREFLRVALEDPRLQSEVLFLDALDERRASGSHQHQILDDVIQRLDQLSRPKVRISCRAADWFGDLDRQELARISPSGEVRVVEILPLTEDEGDQIIRANLGNPSEFLDMVHRQRLEGWLGNPQTLELMIKVARDGTLPGTRSELFERACFLMAGEENRAHRQARRESVTPRATLEAAGFLCAVALLAGLAGFAADQTESDSDFPPLNEIPGQQNELRAAVASRLFRWQEGRAVPVHRTIAEFLAARTLRHLLTKGLPLVRVLRLLTGYDGGTLSDLRGLFAWLTTLTPEHSSALASTDPVALIFYGDPEPLPPSVKRTILEALEGLALQDPWFFYEGGPAQAFGGLADPALVPEFRAALTNPDRPYYFRLAVLAIVAYGLPLPELQEDLLKVVANSPEGIRELAAKGLINVTLDPAISLALLEDVNSGKLTDAEDVLRAHLLESLYPQNICPIAVVNYLLPPKSEWRLGAYYFFLTEGLSSRTPDTGVPELLDGLVATNLWTNLRERGIWGDFVGPLLKRAIELCGASIPAARLWSWLQLGKDEGMQSFLKGEHQQAIRSWFSERPQETIRLYQWWVLEGPGADSRFLNWDFWNFLCNPEIPPELWDWQRSVLEAWTEEKRGSDLLRAVVSSMWQGANRPTLDEIHAWVDQYPKFHELLQPLLKIDLPKRYIDDERVTRRQREKEEERRVRTKNRETIKQALELVQAGRALGILEFLAKWFLNSGSSAEGLNRIKGEFGSDIASAATGGFIASLSLSDLPTPERIGESAAHRRYYRVCHSLAVGAILLQERGMLPDLFESPGVRAALAFEFTDGVHRSRRWFDAVIKRTPATAAKIIEEAWRPLLRKNIEHIPYLYRMDHDPILVLVAREIGFSLLKSCPRTKTSLLEQLVRAALTGTPRGDFAAFVSEQAVHLRGLRRDQYILWLAVSLLVTPNEGLEKLGAYFRKGDGAAKAYKLTAYLEEFNDIGGYSLSTAPAQFIAGLAKLLGATCPPNSPPTEGWVGRHDSYESAQFVGSLIDILGNRVDDETVFLLRALRDDRSLGAWKDKLSHTVEQQRRKVREARYQRPSFSEVLKVLAGGEPTSLADFRAVVCDHLRTLVNEIENGPDSLYRTFWNVTGSGEMQSPLPENEARNRLRNLLNGRLKPLGISAEIEGHYAHGNRGDLKLIYRTMNIPVEAKRHYHREIWTAPRTQLKKKYSIDPEAGGFGIYLVFWFGEAEGLLPKPPTGVTRPSTAEEMDAALRQIYSGEEWRDTEFVCIDCSKRKTATRKKKGKKQTTKKRC